LRWAVGVDGPDRRENEASSFYNLAEVDRVVSLIEALLAERGTRPFPWRQQWQWHWDGPSQRWQRPWPCW
jgi:hypothetical protein